MNLKITSRGYLEFSQEMKPSFSETASMEQELEKQLHEQYAINNNANLSSVIALLVSLFAAIGAYGYVFIHTSNYPKCCCSYGTVYDLSQLLFAAIAALVVLGIMLYVCIYQGFAQRYEQFITHAIRCKYHSQFMQQDDKQTQPFMIFPKGYHPYGKKRCNAIQGLYGVFAKIISLVIFLLSIATIYQIITYCISWDQFFAEYGILSIAFIITAVIIFVFCLKLYFDKQEKYHDLEVDYAMYKPKE
jgi:hypothetical protein